MVAPRLPEPATQSVPSLTRTVCPYLLADDRSWRASSPTREHRCTAVQPAATLSQDKQRRLCLVSAHSGCPAFRVASERLETGSRTGVLMDRPPGAGSRATARTAPLVLDRGRGAAPPAAVFQRGVRPTALLSLVAIAVAGLFMARFTLEPGSPDQALTGPGRSATASPVAPSRGSSGDGNGLPVRTVRPLLSETTPGPRSGGPVATAAPSGPGAAPARYRIKRGDTLVAVARRFGTTAAVLRRLNDIKDASRLRVGQLLELP